jgi:Ca2+-binding RTX toxin-like protein
MTVYNGTPAIDYYDHRAVGYDSLTVYGNRGDDTLIGNTANDYLYGGYENDNLYGWSGNDYLNGFGGGYSRETDTLTGGLGADAFVIGDSTGVGYLGGFDSVTNTDSSYARIADFSWQEGDKIQAYGSATNYNLSSGNWLGGAAEDTGIYYGNDLLGVVQDTTNVSLTQNFNFV